MERATPVLGVVYYQDSHEHRRKIDFLGHPFGLEYSDVHRTSIPVLVDENDPAGPRFRAMHPVWSMESRTHNVAGLPDQYNTPLGLGQLRASIVCAREALRDIIDEGLVHEVRKLNKRIFKFAAYDPHALTVYIEHNIDVFDAILLDDRLPREFLDNGYQRWRERVAKQRSKKAR